MVLQMTNTPLSLDLQYLQEQLFKAPYNTNLGVRKLDYGNTTIGGVSVSTILIQIDPGKELLPHLHETEGGEIWIPLSTGQLYLGKAQKNESSEYIVDTDQKIHVEWDNPIELIPFKSVEVPVNIAHYLYASGEKPLIVIIFLPTSHPATDIKYTTHPK